MTDLTPSAAPAAIADTYGLEVLYEKEATALKAQEDFFREVHLLLQHIDLLLRGAGLLTKSKSGEPIADVLLPGSYHFYPSADPAWAQSAVYSLSYRPSRSDYHIVRTQLDLDGAFKVGYSKEHLPLLTKAIRSGLLGDIIKLASMDKRDRAAFLRHTRSSPYDVIENTS